MNAGWNLFIIIAVLLACGILSGGTIFFYRRRTEKIMDKLDEMLNRAISGSFTEHSFDESKLSALEAKLNRYLSICTVSSKNLSEEKEKVKSLISDISHQTKTPLANIMLYAQILLESESTREDNNTEQKGYSGIKAVPEKGVYTDYTFDQEKAEQEHKNCIRQIYTQSEKLNFLINALVKTSRLETGIISVVPEKNSINQLLQFAMEPILPKAAAKNITLVSCNCDGAACFDMKWTTEALYNILDNAVKYTAGGGSIKVSAISYEMFYRIDIKDNGRGIRKEEQNKIFGRFYRSLEVRQYEGVGIGLYLTREIISSQGGYIKVNSQPGEGSVFSVFLPI